MHSISSPIGTLACVSAFTLLEEALHSYRNASDAADAVVCALIGDVAGAVAAGHITLHHLAATSCAFGHGAREGRGGLMPLRTPPGDTTATRLPRR